MHFVEECLEALVAYGANIEKVRLSVGVFRGVGGVGVSVCVVCIVCV